MLRLVVVCGVRLAMHVPLSCACCCMSVRRSRARYVLDVVCMYALYGLLLRA